jgi:C1A family cysteine protease
MPYKLGGHRPDPDDDEALQSYWDFATQLQPHLAPGTGDADLRPYSSPRHDQGQTGSCVAQSVVKALENLERQELCRQRGISPLQLGADDHKNLSVLALYYLCRERMQPSQVHADSGTYVFLACDCLRRFGVCPEEAWPFDPQKVFEAPSIMAMREAYLHKISAYYRIKQTGQERVRSVIDALRANHPVVYATDVGDNWLNYQRGEVLQLPTVAAGGHATHLVGWDEGRGVFIGENSWGTRWGEDGYYMIAPEVIADSCSRDFWVITGSWEAVHR